MVCYIFGAANGHLSPGLRLAYLALDRISAIDFEVALAFLVACQAFSAVLMQRILELVFGRAWWTFALALAWAISVDDLLLLEFFSRDSCDRVDHGDAGLDPRLPVLAGYRPRAWLVWSLVAMGIGLGFYIKALLILLYLVLMRVLLLDPEARLRDSLRSRRGMAGVACLRGGMRRLPAVYPLGDYQRVRTGATVGGPPRYLRIFWLEGFWPMVFGVRVRPFGHEPGTAS